MKVCSQRGARFKPFPEGRIDNEIEYTEAQHLTVQKKKKKRKESIKKKLGLPTLLSSSLSATKNIMKKIEGA